MTRPPPPLIGEGQMPGGPAGNTGGAALVRPGLGEDTAAARRAVTNRWDTPAQLKAYTAAEHRALESALPLMSPDFTLENYRDYLCALYGYYAPLESQLFAFEEWQSAAVTQCVGAVLTHHQAPLIAEDLTALDGALNGARHTAPQHLPRCDTLPALPNFHAALGVFYVLEGARLGSQIIARHLTSHFAVARPAGESEAWTLPRHFLCAESAQIKSRWQNTLTLLSHHPADPLMLKAAQQTFQTLGAHLRRVLG